MIGEDDVDPGFSDDASGGAGGDFTSRISAAMETVDNALMYGRKLHGLHNDDSGGEQQTAGLTRMPTTPGNQSESGVPRERPFPRLDPTNNPFGKRAELTRMPTTPGNQSESGLPRERPFPRLDPDPNLPRPFGKRTSQNEDGDGGQQYGIPEDEETA